MERLYILMNTVGEQLDLVEQNERKMIEKHMNSYFNRIKEISKLPRLSNRIKFMLMVNFIEYFFVDSSCYVYN
jgi:hypothetical protein